MKRQMLIKYMAIELDINTDIYARIMYAYHIIALLHFRA